MKRLYLLIMLIAFEGLSGLYAQVIEGRVTEAGTGEPLQQASVVLKGAGKGQIAKADGSYRFENVTPGTYTLQVSFLGYKPQEKKVILKGSETAIENFELQSKTFRQEQIVVTATRVGTTREMVPLTTSVVDEVEIEQSTENNILPLLSAKVPGMFVTQRGVSGFGVANGSSGLITIRGVGGATSTSQVLVLIDGQPQMMGIFGHPFADSYVSSDIEKAEVIRGPASLLYGTNAMGGVVNLITRKHRQEGFSGRIRTMYGSYNTLKATGSAGYRKDKFSIFASYNHDQTDGHRENSEFNNNTGYLKLGYKISDHFNIVWDGSYVDFIAHDPGPDTVTTGEYDNNAHWNDINRANTTFTLSNKFDKAEGKIKLFYNKGDHELYDGWNSIDENIGISIFEGLTLFENNLIGAGLDWNRYGGKGSPVFSAFPPGAPPVESPYSDKWLASTETGVYTFIQQTLFDALTANAGIRFQHHNLFGTEWIPQLGLTFKASENTSLKALASKGYRSPNIRELYLFPPANPNLKPEKMWNYEIGLDRKMLSQKLNMIITAFYNKGDNLIQTVPTGSIPPFLNENTGIFEHWGAEAELRYIISTSLNIDANYSYLHMDSPKVASPEHQLYAGVNYLFGNFTINANFQSIRNLYTRVDEGSVEKVNYNLLNTKINYKLSRVVDLFVSGENLTDEKYEINYAYPMPGITLMGGINLNF